MEFKAKVESSGLLLRLRNGQKRLAFATSEALNKTAVELQKRVNVEARKRFTSREPGFLTGTPDRPGGAAAKITKFASVTKGVSYVELTSGLPPLGGRQRRKSPVILPGFEGGTTVGPRKGPVLAVPITGGPARPTFTERVKEEYQFRTMLLKRSKAERRAARRARADTKAGRPTKQESRYGIKEVGQNGTIVLVTPRLPLGGVFVRRGDGLQLVWKFVPRVRRPARPYFYSPIRQNWRAVFAVEMDKQVKATLAYQRYRAVS